MVQKAYRLVANAFELRPKRQISNCRFFNNSVVFYYFFWAKCLPWQNTDPLVSFLSRDIAEIRDFSNSCVNDLGKLWLLSLVLHFVRWVTVFMLSGIVLICALSGSLRYFITHLRDELN